MLRHTAATIAYALGVDWRQIQHMPGHSELGTTMNLYVDEVPQLQREAADQIDRGFGLTRIPRLSVGWQREHPGHEKPLPPRTEGL